MSKKKVAVVFALLLFIAAAGCDLPDSSNVNTTSPLYRYEPGRILMSGHVEDELMKDIIENMNSVFLVAMLATTSVYLGDYFVISPVRTLFSLVTRKRITGNTAPLSPERSEKSKKQVTRKRSSGATPPVDQGKVAPSKATNSITQTPKVESKKASNTLGSRSVAQSAIPTDKTPINEKDEHSNESKKRSKRARKNKRRKAAKKIENSCDDGPRPLNDKITKFPAVEDKASISNGSSNEKDFKSDDKNNIKMNKRSKRGKSEQTDKTVISNAIENSPKGKKNTKSAVPHKADTATPSSKKMSSVSVKPPTVKDGDAKTDTKVAIDTTKTVSSSVCNQQGNSCNNSSLGPNGNNGKPRIGSSSGKFTYAQACKGSVASLVESSQDKKPKTTSCVCNQQGNSNNNSSVGVNGINGEPRLGFSSGNLTYAQACKGSVASLVESSQDEKPKTTSCVCNQQGNSNNNSSLGPNVNNGEPRLGSSSGKITYAQACNGSVASPVESSQHKKPKPTSSGLKTMHVPTRVVSKFLGMAKKNTSNNIETFGALCGKMDTSKNTIALTHLVIPKQVGTADSCEPINLEELVAVQDKYGVIMIGWIHTHPTQSAFLSSVDCHTQCNYQMMFPEMLAIVCSPSYNQIGYFHLDPEHGLSVVAKCNQTGFHRHEGANPPFTNVGHIEFEPEADITSIDLRAEK